MPTLMKEAYRIGLSPGQFRKLQSIRDLLCCIEGYNARQRDIMRGNAHLAGMVRAAVWGKEFKISDWVNDDDTENRENDTDEAVMDRIAAAKKYFDEQPPHPHIIM